MIDNTTEKIKIFWTGGLDSTFRLVQLLFTTKHIVEPHYIVRHEDSTGIEIDTMIQIRRALTRKYPEVRSRFLPTVYVNEAYIPEFEDVKEEIEELKKKESDTRKRSQMSDKEREELEKLRAEQKRRRTKADRKRHAAKSKKGKKS